MTRVVKAQNGNKPIKYTHAGVFVVVVRGGVSDNKLHPNVDQINDELLNPHRYQLIDALFT